MENNFKTVSNSATDNCNTCEEHCSEILNIQSQGTKNFVYVEFKGHRKEIFLNYKNIKLFKDDNVIVTAEIGVDLGRVVYVFNSTEEILEKKYNRKISKTIVRKAIEHDLEKAYINRCEEDDIVDRTGIIAQSFALEMKVVDVE
jgi:cell fate regulator YaaT (PSP1 superfamily)